LDEEVAHKQKVKANIKIEFYKTSKLYLKADIEKAEGQIIIDDAEGLEQWINFVLTESTTIYYDNGTGICIKAGSKFKVEKLK
jgi:hypothetical protein